MPAALLPFAFWPGACSSVNTVKVCTTAAGQTEVWCAQSEHREWLLGADLLLTPDGKLVWLLYSMLNALSRDW